MYQVGWAKTEITGLLTQGHAMFGWGMWYNRATGHETPLFARTISITDNTDTTAIICCLDLGSITYPMRSGAVAKLKATLGDAFDENSFVMTATHTHSGPGGCSSGSMYNVITPGYVPEHVDAIVNATVTSVLEALASRKSTDVSLMEDAFADHIGVAWNRSIAAYNANADTSHKKLSETHLAIDRTMRVLSFERDGTLVSLLSLFGVHPTCVGNTHTNYNGDNKGYAAAQTEQALQDTGVTAPVAVFAQGVAGDVSPYFQGKGDIAKRAKLNKADQIAYAQRNGKLQSDKALSTLKNQSNVMKVQGEIASTFMYVDFSDVTADPKFANNQTDATTADPCLGVTMFEGTRVDGPGMPKAIGLGATVISRQLKRSRLKSKKLGKTDATYYQNLYKAHGKKNILMECERKLALGRPLAKISIPGFVDPTLNALKKQAATGAMDSHSMIPKVIPLQIIRIGSIAIVCYPGEVTTVAGQRLQSCLSEQLAQAGVEKVLIMSYCNEYMGYVTTQEEYQTQLYEGGHTAFGQWTQAAFQTKFCELAEALTQSPEQHSDAYRAANQFRPTPVPENDRAKLTGLKPPKKW